MKFRIFSIIILFVSTASYAGIRDVKTKIPSTTADIAASTDKNYVTDAQAVVIGNTSGTNTGDQTNITGNAATVTTNANLTGVVTSVGNATAIADAALSVAKTSGLQTALDAKAPLASPIFTTNITTPVVIGGTSTIQTITYKTTTGVGATGADHIFQVGDNGSVEAVRISNNGNVGIGTTVPLQKLHTTGNMVIGNDADFGIAAAGSRLEIRGPHNDGVASLKSINALKLSVDDNLFYGQQVQLWLGRWEDVSNNSRSSLIISLMNGQSSANANADTNVMTLLSNGNVGIGTTAPGFMLTLAAGGALGIIGSYTDASNYYALKAIMAAGGATISINELGTGIGNRDITLTPSGTGNVIFFASKAKIDSNGKPFFGTVGDSTASPGNATLNTITGKSAIAAAASSMVLTNSNIATTSLIDITPLDIDATATNWKYSVAAGSATITTNAATTATWKFSWSVKN